MPVDDDDLFDTPRPKPSSGKIVHQPAGSQWSLERLPEVESLYQTSFKRKLPLANRGQGSVHNRFGYDHRNSADVSLNPSTPEGQQFVEQLKAKGVPFLAFDRAIPGVSTGPHIHLGFPSKKTQQRFNVGSQRKSKAVASDDLFDKDGDLFDSEQSPPPTQRSKSATSPTRATAAPNIPIEEALRQVAEQASGITAKVQRIAPAPDFSNVPGSTANLRRRDSLPVNPEIRVRPTDRVRFGDTFNARYQPSPAMSARRPGVVERAREQLGEAARTYTPGLASIDTPGGIKTDVLRGAASGITLGALGDRRQVSREEALLDPQAQARADLAHGIGETVSAVVPYAGATRAAGVIPALRGVGRLASAGRIGTAFGGVSAAREGVKALKTGEPISPSNIAIDTAVGAAMGAIPGANPRLRTVVTAAVAPQLAADVARGVPMEQAAQNAVTNLLFAGYEIAGRGDSAAARRAHVARRLEDLKGEFGESQVETQPDVTAQREAVESAGEPRVPSVRPILESVTPQESQPLRGDAVLDTSQRVGVEPQRFYHRDYGEVVKAEDQSGARRGRVKVYEADNPDKIHYIKDVQLTGAGNQRAVPVRPSPEIQENITESITPKPTEAPAPIPTKTAATESQLTTPKEVTDAVAEPSSGAIKPLTQAREAASAEAVSPIADSAVSVETQKQATPIPDRPTSVKNAATEELRRDLDLLEIEGPEVKTWQQTIDNAKSRKLDEQAEQIAKDVIDKKRQLSEEDEAGIQLRMRELENRWEEVYRQDPKSPELTDIKQRLDNLTRASKEGGTPLARALAFRRSFVDKDYKLISVVQRAEKAAGRRLSEKEFQQFEQQAARVQELEANLAEANKKAESETLQRDVDRLARRERRFTAKMTLDTEYESLKGQLAQIRSKTTEGFFRSERGELDPEAVKVVARMARNRIRAGVTDATRLVDDIYTTVQEHLPKATRRDVQDAISGYGREPQRTRSDEAKQLSQVQSELKKLSAQEDIASGKRLSSQDKRRQTQLRKQEIEIKDRLAREDFDQRAPRPKPHYTRETRKLQEEVQNLKNKLDLEIERNRPGHGWRTFSALRKSWMLSGLSTQAKNILGTGGYQAFDELARIPAVITDAAVAGRTGQRGITTSPTQILDGILQAYRVGGKEAIEILKRGATQEQLERHQFAEIDTPVKLINFTGNIVFRFMSASDRVFYNYAYKRNLSDRATVQAKNEGAGRERAKELLDNPPEELAAAANLDAQIATFNNNNRLSNAIKGARAQLGPKANFAIDLVMPFDRTPTNVIARILEASPSGFAKAATGGYKQSPLKVAKSIIDKSMTVEEQRQFSQTIGRATAGSAIIGLGWALGDSLFDVEKYKVYIKIPGVGRFDLTSVSPLGNMLALGARYRKNYEEGKPWEAVKATTRIPLDQPLLQAGSNLADVVKDPERSFTRQASRTASSFIPFGGAVRDAAKLIDPEEKRKARGFTEQIQQGIPGWRQSLPVDVDKKQVRERQTEDVRQGSLSPFDLEIMVESGEITEAQRKQILRDSKLDASQARFNAIAPSTALGRYERMDPAQRQEVEEIMSRKAHSLLNSDALTEEQKEAFRVRIEALGITPEAPKKSTGNRAMRGFQSTFK